jgi:poly(3-hydroxybutyrate) depolymerase
MLQRRRIHLLAIVLLSGGCAADGSDSPESEARTPVVAAGAGGSGSPSVTAGASGAGLAGAAAMSGTAGGGAPQSGTGGAAGASAGNGGAAGTAGTGGAAGTSDGGPPAASSGCGSAWMAPDAEVEQSRRGGVPMLVARREITIDGAPRLYLVAVPMAYDGSTPYPLVFGFHGLAGSREQLRGYMNVEAAAAGDALFIYPEGLPVDGGETGWSLGSTSTDLAFIDALLEQYKAEWCVDENRIFATGHSYGGCMSNTVGCARGDVFRAIAPVAGCGPQRRGGAACVGQVAALLIHSPKDTTTDYGSGISGCTTWLRANHCDEMPACGCHWVEALEESEMACMQEAQEPYDPVVTVTVTPEEDDAPPVFRSYVGCDAGYPVVFADHYNRENRQSEERWHNPPPWAPALIWHFFSTLPAVATP